MRTLSELRNSNPAFSKFLEVYTIQEIPLTNVNKESGS